MQRLGLHVKQLSEARTEDKKHIQKLERELLNCSQEIGSGPFLVYLNHLMGPFKN